MLTYDFICEGVEIWERLFVNVLKPLTSTLFSDDSGKNKLQID